MAILLAYVFTFIVILECTPTYKEKFTEKQHVCSSGSSLDLLVFTVFLDCI